MHEQPLPTRATNRDRTRANCRIARRQFLRGLAVLGALPLVGASVAATPAAVVSRPRAASGRVVVAQGVDPNSIDPPFANGIPEKNILRHMFDTLVDRDPKTLKIVPNLA